MSPARPILGDVELQQVQSIEVGGDQVLVQHAVPALEGDFLQGLGRRGAQVRLSGVLTGPEAAEGLKNLRTKFRAAEPVPFVADITTATRVGQVLIEEMGVRELAGKPERFEYALTLREYIPLSAPEAEPAVNEEATADAAQQQEAVVDQIDARQGTIEVTVEPAEPSGDLSQVQVQIQGQTENGQDYVVVLDQQTDGVFRKTDVPAGQYSVTLLIPS